MDADEVGFVVDVALFGMVVEVGESVGCAIGGLPVRSDEKQR